MILIRYASSVKLMRESTSNTSHLESRAQALKGKATNNTSLTNNGQSWVIAECSLANSRHHSINADVIAEVKTKIIVSRGHFFTDVIFSATSKN